MHESKMSLTEGLADLILRPVSAADRDRARSHVLDWIGVTAAAVDSTEGRILAAHIADEPGGEVGVVGGPPRGRLTAAFINAGLGLVLELDDTHRQSRLHPGPIVVPAALAVAEARGASVGDVLTAVTRGYEAMVRIGESVGDEHYEHWHLTSSCGPFGAAAAAASILGLDRTQLVHALGNAGTQSAGLWQCRPEHTMSKPLHAGRAAVAGIEAAELARLGLTGPRFILEGSHGFYAATCPDARPDAVTGGAAEWRIHSCSFKPWPGCRHVHPTMGATQDLGILPSEVATITSVEVRTYGVALEFADRPAPTRPTEARFSLQHAVAAILVGGQADLQVFDQSRIDDPTIAALRDKVTVVRDEAFDGLYPDHWGATVTVDSTAGRRTATVGDALGDPENPLAAAALAGKARDLLDGAGFDAQAAIAAVLELPEDAPASRLMAPLIRRAHG